MYEESKQLLDLRHRSFHIAQVASQSILGQKLQSYKGRLLVCFYWLSANRRSEITHLLSAICGGCVVLKNRTARLPDSSEYSGVFRHEFSMKHSISRRSKMPQITGNHQTFSGKSMTIPNSEITRSEEKHFHDASIAYEFM